MFDTFLKFLFRGSIRHRALLASLHRIESNQNIIMASQTEAAAQIRALTAQIQKISAESSTTLQKVTDLQAVIDAGTGVSPELQAAVDELKAQIQVVDDLVPDVTPPAPTPTPEPAP